MGTALVTLAATEEGVMEPPPSVTNQTVSCRPPRTSLSIAAAAAGVLGWGPTPTVDEADAMMDPASPFWWCRVAATAAEEQHGSSSTGHLDGGTGANGMVRLEDDAVPSLLVVLAAMVDHVGARPSQPPQDIPRAGELGPSTCPGGQGPSAPSTALWRPSDRSGGHPLPAANRARSDPITARDSTSGSSSDSHCHANRTAMAAGSPSARRGRPASALPPLPPRKRRRATYTAGAKPRRSCHLCNRHAPAVALLPCGALAVRATCRKVVCHRCFDAAGPAGLGGYTFGGALAAGSAWRCWHCVGGCPPRASCATAGRVHARLRQARRAGRGEGHRSGGAAAAAGDSAAPVDVSEDAPAAPRGGTVGRVGGNGLVLGMEGAMGAAAAGLGRWHSDAQTGLGTPF